MPEFKFELKVADQVIAAAVKLPAEPIRPVDLLPILFGFSSAVIGAASADKAISCKAGCGACCRQLVPISETEAIYLIDLVDKMPAERKARVMERFRDAEKRLDEAGLTGELWYQAMAVPEERKRVGLQYFRLGIACPFLENESCGIHPDRPITCREYLVTSPAENCKNPGPDTIEMVPVPGQLSYNLYRFGDGVGNDPVKFLPLTMIFRRQFSVQPRMPGVKLFENFFAAVTSMVEPKTREIEFEIVVGAKALRASAKIPEAPIRPVDLLPVFQGMSNAVVESTSAGHPVTCAKGCGACCRQVVPISETEAIYLAQMVDQMPVDRKAVIVDRFTDAMKKIRSAGIAEALTQGCDITVEQQRKIAFEYFSLGIPCPFLEDESCSIHPHRPMSCREYLVVSPPSECAKLPNPRIQSLKMPKKVSEILFHFGDGAGKARPKMIPLTLLLEFATPEQPRLPGPEMFENFFREFKGQTT